MSNTNTSISDDQIKLSEYINTLYAEFVRDSSLLVKQNFEHAQTKIKAYKESTEKLDEYTKESIEKGIIKKSKNKTEIIQKDFYHKWKRLYKGKDDPYRGIWLSGNANFIYLLSLQETFLYKLISIALENNESLQIKYFQYFGSESKHRIKQSNDTRLSDIISSRKELDHIAELPLIKLITHLYSIDTNGKNWQRYFSDFIEARERRNLFVHRSIFMDEKYEESIKNAFRSWKNGPKLAEKHLEKITNESVKNSGQSNPEGKVDLCPAPVYLQRIHSAIFFISSVIYARTFISLNSDLIALSNNEKGEDIFKNTLNDIQVGSKIIGSILVNDVVSHVKKNCLDENWSLLPILTKVNYLVAKKNLTFILKSESTKKKFDDEIDEIFRTMKKDHTDRNDTFILNILSAFIDNDVDEYLKKCKIYLAEDNRSIDAINDWAMTDILKKNNKKFDQKLNKFQN